MKRPTERDRIRARKRRGFRAGRTVFSILLVAVLCVMVGYVWGAVREKDAGGPAIADSTKTADPIAATAPAATAIPMATAAPVATPVPTAKLAPVAAASPEASAAQTEKPVEVVTMATESEPTLEPSEEADEPSTAEWPADRFPGVAAYPGEVDVSYLEEGLAQILLPKGADAGFADYAAKLVGLGASKYVDNARLIVLKLGDVEIQLIPDGDSPSIMLCDENAIFWDDPDDVLPLSGRLVAWEEGEDGLGAVLTYRCVSFAGLMDYLDLLRREGWTTSDPAVPVEGALFAVYARGDRSITVDYYANSSNFQISLGARVLQ